MRLAGAPIRRFAHSLLPPLLELLVLLELLGLLISICIRAVRAFIEIRRAQPPTTEKEKEQD